MSSIFGGYGPTKKPHNMENSLEKECLIAQGDESRRRSSWNNTAMKVLAITLIGCCFGLVWVALTECAPGSQDMPTTIAESHLEKYDAPPIPSATPSVLEVFQVYQPVLTPEGLTDETIPSDDAEHKASLASASSGVSCQVLLMDHVFAFSYGQPFVGMLWFVSLLGSANLWQETTPLQAASSTG